MTANAAVVLPQPDSPTRPYDSPFVDRERQAAQHRPVDAADAVDDLEVVELEVAGAVTAHRSKVCAMRVGDQVDADDQRRDREGREEDGPPEAGADE